MKVALSWSGGKDACYTLHKLHEQGIEVACLLTTIPEELNATFGHGEKKEAIEAQSEALGIPIEWIYCTFSTYTDDFIEKVKEVKDQYRITGIAYGDLYLDEHREWGENVAKAAQIEALYPLWMKKDEAKGALQQFVSSGYRAKVIRVMQKSLSVEWLGREVDESFYQDIVQLPVCPMGESGEYHTFVYDGPLFQKKVVFEAGEVETLESTWRLHLENIHMEQK